jgi:glycerophosphoryl diester phosphodiesterase
MTDRILVASFYSSVVKRITTKLPKVATSAGHDSWSFCTRLTCSGSQAATVCVCASTVWSKVGPLPIITKSLVAAAHQLKLEIHEWTVNEPAEMKRLIRLNVDYYDRRPNTIDRRN